MAVGGACLVTITPGVIYGPGIDSEGNLVGRLIRDHLAGRLPGIIGADRTWAFSFVDDVADAHVRAMAEGEPGADYAPVAKTRRRCGLSRSSGIDRRPLPRRIPASVAFLVGLADEIGRRWGDSQTYARNCADSGARLALGQRAYHLKELSYRMTPLVTGIRAILAQQLFDNATSRAVFPNRC